MRTVMLALAVLLAVAFVPSAPAAADDATATTAAYPAIEFIPAATANYAPLRRGNRPRYIVIHDTEISFDATIRAFQNPRSRVSAHYVVRGSDGHIVQMVNDWDEAWHAGNLTFNRLGIGIEHELDRYTNPTFTVAQYQSSAKLACAIASRYDIPLDRAHVIGHNEVPWPSTHTDPGPTWNWPYYMGLIRECGEPRLQSYAYHSRWTAQQDPGPVASGGTAEVSVTLRNTGLLPWVKGTRSEVRLGVVNDSLVTSVLGYAGSDWLNGMRPAAQALLAVPPGGVTTFHFTVRGAARGSHRILLRPLIEGATWLEHEGIYVDVIVR